MQERGQEIGDGIVYIVWFRWFFSYWHESMGMASDYLFCCLFLDYIFWLGTKNLFTLYDSNDLFHTGMKAWAWQGIICFIVRFWTKYFCWGWRLGMGVWGREHGAESNFYLRIYFTNTFFHFMIEIIFFTFTWKHGWGEWFFLIYSLFLDYIFWWEQGDGSVGTQSSGQSGGWSMRLRAIFFWGLISKKISLYDWNIFFTLTWKHGWGEWLFDS